MDKNMREQKKNRTKKCAYEKMNGRKYAGTKKEPDKKITSLKKYMYIGTINSTDEKNTNEELPDGEMQDENLRTKKSQTKICQTLKCPDTDQGMDKHCHEGCCIPFSIDTFFPMLTS